MDALVIVDRDGVTPVSGDLVLRLRDILEVAGCRVEVVDLTPSDAAPCRGCLLCLTKHPGECVTRDAVGSIMRRMHTDHAGAITIFVTPVRFGHPSSTIKNAIDRGCGSRDLQVFIGFDSASEEEESTFSDLFMKHRGSADIVHPGMDQEVQVYVAKSSDDNVRICRSLEDHLSRGGRR